LNIHVYFPANDTFIAYEYKFDENKNKLTLEYNSNFPHKGKIIVLNPWYQSSTGSQENGQSKFEVRMDGAEIPIATVRINYDEFIIIETDFKKHLVEIEPVILRD